MVSRRTDRLLHKITHHTNLEQPYDKNISGIIYPAQDADLLGRTVTLRYKNRYLPESDRIFDEMAPDRYDDPTMTDEDVNIHEAEFIVLRCDLSEPFRAIFLSVDYTIMLVGDSRTYQDNVLKYPKQIEEYIGLYLIDQYFETPFIHLNGVVLSCDSSEPGNGIIAEFYADNTVRFLLDYEVQAVVLDRYDPDGERDYNGMDPEDHPFVYINLDGKFARNEGEDITINADGGYPDPLADMYRRDILTLKEVCELRSRIIHERRIYGSQGITPREVIVTPDKATLYDGETLQLEAEIKPPLTPFKEITWRSSDESLATVDENGLVTGIGSGKVKIYAINTDVWGRCIVDARVTVRSIEFDPPSITLPIGETYKLKPIILPENATDKKVTWSSSDESLATIDENGLVTGIGEGPVVITARSANGVEGVCNIQVIDTYVPVESIIITNLSTDILNLSTNSLELDEFVLEVQVLPENATNKNIFSRVANKYDDFAVYVEDITENRVRIKGLCYDCGHPNIVEIHSQDNPNIIKSIKVNVDTLLESTKLSKDAIDLDPDFISGSIRTTAELDIIFYPQNESVVPDVITAGVNEEGVLSVMETLTNSNEDVVTIIDTESYKTVDHYALNKLIVKAKDPGTSQITITDPISGEVHTCNVLVGEEGIKSIVFKDVPDWEYVKPGDIINIKIIVDPDYWYEYPDLYNIIYTIEGNEDDSVEIIDNTTYITLKIKKACSNITVTATANSGISNSFTITEVRNNS